MSYEMKEDTATLFKNDRKETDTQPDYTGKIKQNGKERRLAAWITKSKAGQTYMSLKVSDFLNAADGIREGMSGSDGQNKSEGFDDDIPF